MKNAMKIVVALLGLAASAPAQIQVEGRLGRRVHVAAQIGTPSPRPVVRSVVRTVASPRDHGHREHRHGHRGHDHGHRRHHHHQAHHHVVWVPGCFRIETVPARYGWLVDACGHRYWGVVQPACERRVWVPGHFETRYR